MAGRVGGSCFWTKWRRWFRGLHWKLWCVLTMPGRAWPATVGLSVMLRTHFLQQWFNLSDAGVAEAFYESSSLRRFAAWALA